MTAEPRPQSSSRERPNARERGRSLEAVLPVALWSLVVWAACLTATAMGGGPAGAVDLGTVHVVLPGAVAAACAAHGLSSAEGLPTTGPTAVALQGLAGAAAVLAVGLPIVATAVGGIPQAVREGVEGLLVPPREPRQR